VRTPELAQSYSVWLALNCQRTGCGSDRSTLARCRYNLRQPLAKHSNLAESPNRYKIDTAKLAPEVRDELSKEKEKRNIGGNPVKIVKKAKRKELRPRQSKRRPVFTARAAFLMQPLKFGGCVLQRLSEPAKQELSVHVSWAPALSFLPS
jgi:hypothetical protein